MPRLRLTVNGQELPYAKEGYRYEFSENYRHWLGDELPLKDGSRIYLKTYDNGVIIKTWFTPDQVVTEINRNIVVDTAHRTIYVLAPGQIGMLGASGIVLVESD